MTLLPILGLTVAFLFFVRRVTLTDQSVQKITETLKAQKGVEPDA